MLETELTETVKEFKSPPIKFIIICSIVIIATLVTVIVYQSKKTDTVDDRNYNALISESAETKRQLSSKQHEIDSLKDKMTDYFMKELENERQKLENERQKREVKIFIDSVNTEVDKLKKTLR